MGRRFEPAWIEGRGVTRRAGALLAAIERADAHGLRRADYPVDALRSAVAMLGDRRGATAQQLAEADVRLTAALIAYGDDMLTGRVDPRAVEPSWHIDPRAVNVDSVLRHTLEAEQLDDALARLAPQEEGYATLVVELARYRALERAGGWPSVPAGPALAPGDSSARVPVVRARLQAEGYLAPDGGTAADDAAGTRYNGAMASTVARFQARHGLAADSVIGPRTLAALRAPVARRIAQIEANLERYRWIPRDLGERYVMVNIPAFRLAAYDRGARVLTMPVVVGSELASRATPVFSDSMSYVQFGPYWNVPRSIAVNEILPKARRDRGYLARNDFEMLRGCGNDAPVVSPWELSDAALFSSRYRVRQRPGPGNALGRVKFIFPNDFNVYLHDTPAQALFDERVRAASHGCVRVARPADLAHFVLGGQPGWDEGRIREVLADGRRERVVLPRKLPVYLLYLTTFVHDGELVFRDDIYGMDDRLMRALAAPPRA